MVIKDDRFECACGRVWFFPDHVIDNLHIQYTLICSCSRVYAVVHGCLELKTKPQWRWKRARR